MVETEVCPMLHKGMMVETEVHPMLHKDMMAGIEVKRVHVDEMSTEIVIIETSGTEVHHNRYKGMMVETEVTFAVNQICEMKYPRDHGSKSKLNKKLTM